MDPSIDKRAAGLAGRDVAFSPSRAVGASTRQKAPPAADDRHQTWGAMGQERAMGASTAGVFGHGTAAPPPLVVSSYTLGTEVGFEDRVRAAAAAGYEGIGLRAENYWDAQAAGLDDTAMCEIAAQNGVPILEVEYITAWGTPEDRDAAQQEKEQAVFHMARAFGVRHLNTGLLEKLPLDVMTEAFAALCDRAGDDLTV